MKTPLTKTQLILTFAALALAGFFGSGAFREKPEAALPVIKAGTDDRGNLVCVNKSQVYLLSRDASGRRILFHFHDPGARDGFSIVKKVFSSREAMDEYWEILVKQW